MKHLIALIVIVLGTMLVTACPQPTPPVPPGPEPVTTASAVCANLSGLGCPEGLRGDCVAVVQKVIDTGITDLRTACLTEAATVDEVRACGSVACVLNHVAK